MYVIRLLLCLLIFSQPACSQKSAKPVLLMNASVHQGNGEVIENAALAFDTGKITLLADARVIRLDMRAFEVIDAYGSHIYPAVAVDTLPAFSPGDSLFYASPDNTSKKILIGNKISAGSVLPILEEGAEATFLVAEDLLNTNVAIRYLVIKGKIERDDVSFQLFSNP